MFAVYDLTIVLRWSGILVEDDRKVNQTGTLVIPWLYGSPQPLISIRQQDTFHALAATHHELH